MVTRLRQLTELRAAQRNQRLLVTDKVVLKSFRKLLDLVQTQIRDLEVAIAGLIDADAVWHKLDQSFRSIKGVADRTVARLMAEMPEIGRLSNKKISKLAGLAPLACDSGQQKGKRSVRGGRRTIREILFVVAAGVSRHNADFRAFRERLAAAGKAKKVIRIALAPKPLVRLNAKARDLLNQLREPHLLLFCFLKYQSPSRRSVGGKWETQPRFPSGPRPRLFHNQTNPHTLDKTDSRSTTLPRI